LASLLDAVSTFLVKHSPAEFARGELALAPVLPPLVVVALVGLGVGAAVVAARSLRGTSARERRTFGALRIATFLLLGLCLLRPTLVLSRAVPQRNVLAVVLDDSRSMRLADHPAGSRLEAVRGAFADSTAVVRALGDQFVLQFFRADAAAAPIAGASELTGGGLRSDLGAALAGVRLALAGRPVAGIVLVGDGADNGTADLERELLALEAQGIPVHTVGVGTQRFTRDVAVEALRLPASVLEGGEAVGEVVVRLRGVASARVALMVEAAGRLVALDTVQLPADRELAAIPIRIPPLEPGTHLVTARVAPVDGEPITQNNAGAAAVRVRTGPEKVLHVEGEPRPDLPFMRRALAADSAVRLVSLLRSAPGKYLRLGVDDSLDLVAGFPTTREELFRYRGIVLGSVEAAFFTAEQVRMLEEFVSLRGGGLLALGGRRALAEGGYGGTALDAVLPVALAGVTPLPEGGSARMVTPELTDAGMRHPMLALAATQEATLDHWARLPAVSSVNAPAAARAGATVLLSGRDAAGGGTIPLLAMHRYGKGRAALFGVQDAWRWQLNASVPEDDASLALLWPRLIRWTLDEVPEQLELELVTPVVAPGETGELVVQVHDAGFLPTDRAAVTLTMLPPDAPALELPLEPVLGAPGRFHVRAPTRAAGAYRLNLRAVLEGDSLQAPEMAMLAVAGEGEPGNGERNDALLARIAERTGGAALDIGALEALPELAATTRAGITVREPHDLWDAPLMLLVLLGLLATDWTLRRRRGLG
jgi:uncharacterized membrane protein